MNPWKVCALLLCLICSTQSATPAFLQAITSALGSIPFTGFPMSGLTGAKLAVGGKLLYYLGLFGGRGQPKPPTQFGSMPGSFSQNQFSPAGANFMSGQQGMLGGNFMQQQIPSNVQKPPPNPMVIMQALTDQGINPLQLMQALTSAGIDPTQMLEAMSGGGPGNRAGKPQSPVLPPQIPQGMSGSSGFMNFPGQMAGGQFPPQMPPLGGRPPKPSGAASSFLPPQSKPVPGGSSMPHDFSNTFPPTQEHADNGDEESVSEESEGEEDIESFFAFLKDMDDNKCISRLICDIGADPDFLGEFTRNIDNIINSLEAPSGGGALEYMRILELGRTEGECAGRFPECDEDAYEIVKSVAPSVGVPGLSAGGNQL